MGYQQSHYVEIELSNPDQETRVENVGPFTSRERAATFADSLGKAAGLTQNNPDIPGFWVGRGQYEDGTGYQQDTHVTVMVRVFNDKRVRPNVKLVKDFLRGED